MRRATLGVFGIALLSGALMGLAAGAGQGENGEWRSSSGLPAPSSRPLQDYERNEVFPWLLGREYAALDWAVDKELRDTGPFVDRVYYGTHPAVRIYYSPEVMEWLEGGRYGELRDGAVIVKEMFPAPVGIYRQLRRHPYLAENPEAYQRLLAELLDGWAVFIKDRGGDSVDGWFYTGPSAKAPTTSMEEWLDANQDDYQHVLYSGFGLGTCVRCHASAEAESTFSAQRNIAGLLPDEAPLQFRGDDSWRDKELLGSVYTKVEAFLRKAGDPGVDTLMTLLDIPAVQRPWRPEEEPLLAEARAADPHLDEALTEDPELADFEGHHARGDEDGDTEAAPAERKPPNPLFLEMFAAGQGVLPEAVRPFPMEFADHVYPSPGIAEGGVDNRDQFITSDNCMGCHGGLGGAPPKGFGYQVNMFLQTGPAYGEGYNISEYGEWRWSPMGLAGRDPIFHAQLESELILLMMNAGALPGTRPDPKSPLVGTLRENQVALIDTCLSCHGAMGERQLEIDHGQGRTLPSGNPLNRDFDPDFYYLVEPLTEQAASNPPQPRTAETNTEPNPVYPYASAEDFADYHRYGALAREGISCAVCHHITGPVTTPAGKEGFERFLQLAAEHDGWLPESGETWSDTFVYFLAENTTGQFERGPADELYGPFDDVTPVPMENGLAITPKHNPFTSESEMCGTCHTINLPNVGETENPNPVLTAIENNPAFEGYSHSIEQATYLEWLNSSFGPGVDNRGPEDNPAFRSCQDCHMPNRFRSLDGSIEIEPLTARIASIQDSTYPEAEHAVAPEEMEVPRREDYRRHELVGLNGFLVQMVSQFPEVLGVSNSDYETGANNGAELAVSNMRLAAEERRVVELEVSEPVRDGGDLVTRVTVTNRTGHRFPSGVAFRRAFIELAVLDAADEEIWVSGKANGVGVLVDPESGRPLPTEFLDQVEPGNRLASYQPNYQVITRQDQVQIYEELITDAADAFTTSFIHRITHVKDNRLLPNGWVPAATFARVDPETGVPAEGEVIYEMIEATEPEGPSVVGGPPLIGPRPLDNDGDPGQREYRPDPDYAGAGSDGSDSLTYRIPVEALKGEPTSVRVTVYSQALMPAWLRQRFSLAAEARAAGLTTPETDRLLYVASRLELSGTGLDHWKLPLVTETRPIER